MKTSPTVHALDLGHAISQDLSASTIQRMALAYQDLGLWSPDMPVNDQGHTLSHAWLRAGAYTTNAFKIPEEIGQWLLSLQPLEKLWERGSSSQGSLTAALSNNIGDKSAENDFFLSRALWDALPVDALRRLKVASSVSPSNAMAFAIEKNRTELVELLLEKGWDWNYSTGDTMVKAIASVEMWKVFLASGGDPRQEVTWGDPGDNHFFRGPLWQYFAQIKYASSENEKALRDLAIEYGNAVSPSLMAAVEDQKYWKKLRVSTSIQEVESAIVSRKDWDKLRNSDGQNVLMVGLVQNLNIVKKLGSKKKGIPLFSQVDNQGWGLWHYLMANKYRQGFDALPLDEWYQTLEHAPKQPDPSKGLVASVLLATPNDFNQHAFIYPYGLFAKQGALTPEQVWGGTPENQDAVARILLGEHAYIGGKGTGPGPGLSTSAIVKNLGRLLNDCPLPTDTTPLLKGAVAAYAMLVRSYSGSAPIAAIQELIQSGAAIDMTPQFQGKIAVFAEKSAELTSALEQMKSNFRALQLESSLPKPSAASSKPRF